MLSRMSTPLLLLVVTVLTLPDPVVTNPPAGEDTDTGTDTELATEYRGLKNPTINFTECGNHNRALICDPNNILDKEKVKDISRSIMEIMRTNPCPCHTCKLDDEGYVFGVAVVPEVYVKSGQSTFEAVRDFAVSVTDSWQLGSCGNDAVMVLAINQNQVYTASGDRLSQHVSDVCLEEANRAALRHFRDKQWEDGILLIMDEYKAMTEVGCYKVRASEYINEAWLYGVLAGLSVVMVLLIMYTVTRCSPPVLRDEIRHQKLQT